MIDTFLSEVISKYEAGDATEHSYRAPLENLFTSMDDEVRVINEAQRVRQVGSPDFTFKRKQETGGDLTIGVCECKDIGKLGLSDKGRLVFPDKHSTEQFERYLEAFSNLLYTDGFTWVFFRDHQAKPAHIVTIAENMMGVQQKPENFPILLELLKDFVAQKPVSITTSKDLAERMAAKAKLLRFVFHNALKEDEDFRSELGQQYTVFKEKLIHDITPEGFAGIYAETITYGLFAARLQDTRTPHDFSRAEAYELLPRSNPFLRKFFQFIARGDLDEGLVRVVDDLVEIFLVSHPWEIMESYGKSTARNDPFLHFYEDFLAAYDPKTRKARGVWYTPEPVVDFIVRAVDDVLKTEFGLRDGLADTSKTTIKVRQQSDLSKKVTRKKEKIDYFEEEVHRVQILDPAVGTGTFLAQVIKLVSARVKGSVGDGAWSKYVEDNLIKRLHGFELLMASYAMCHLKLDMELKATGYVPSDKPPRASVYLTNSLEEGEPVQPVLMLERWLADEAHEANRIKTEKPIMCVIGNPPYLGEGGKSEGWLGELMEDYKKEPGGKQKLQERNPKWLNDLYVKFIRLAEHYIEKNGEGVLAFITNHGYLDNPTFRGMRWHLLKTFDTIYVLDLHGNAKKKERSPDGSKDVNVFDIQQGVAIIIGVKKSPSHSAPLISKVFHGNLWGTRKSKAEVLYSSSPSSFEWRQLEMRENQFYFVHRDYDLQSEYEQGFSLNQLMPTNSMGVMTKRDSVTIHFDHRDAQQAVDDFATLSRDVLESKYSDIHDARDWNLAGVKDNLGKFGRDHIRSIMYRPFDWRHTYYTDYSRGFLAYPVFDVGQHMLKNNMCLTTIRKADVIQDWTHAFCLDGVMVHHALSMKEGNYIFPLYLYPGDGANTDVEDGKRKTNFSSKLYRAIRQEAGLGDESDEAAEAIFDYIYGVLHCPAYRETYAEFLKTDFPRIPWPVSPESFRDISGKGNALRRLHLMEDEAIGETPFLLEGHGDNLVADRFPKFRETENGLGEVLINKDQYFTNASKIAWEFWIGGYQPAQKWLKDRRGRELSFEDIRHYQKILKILAETDRIMKTIEMPLGEVSSS